MKILIILIFFSNISFANYNKDRLYSLLSQKSQPDWFTCKLDVDCKYLIGPCNIAFGFNKKFERDIFKFLESLSLKDKQCVDYVGARWPYGSECLKNKCELVFFKKGTKK